jgi:alkyldihydroxyacetonephosphate synthase
VQSAEETIRDLSQALGSARVIVDRAALLQPEQVLVRQFEKAFEYVPEHLPVCILKLATTEEVSQAVQYCNENGLSVITQTGASSSEDQLLVVNDHTVVFDLSGMDAVISLDAENMMATVGSGMPLARLERLANEQGLTTGHWPQSQPMACMGGLVATRSIGQFSTYYGGIEDMLCGLEAVLPDGQVVRIRNVPRSAAGPDLRHFFLGSEGTIAVITEVTVKLFTHYPDSWRKRAYVVPSFEAGLDAIREVMVKGYRPGVVRLYDKLDMDLNYPNFIELQAGEACMFFVAEGPDAITDAIAAAIDDIAPRHGARAADTAVVDHWLRERNEVCKILGTEVIRSRYRDSKIFYTTCEVSASWTDIKRIYRNVMANVPQAIDNLVALGGHVSHSYQNGTNIYFVYMLAAKDPLRMYESDRAVKNAIVTEVLKEPTGGGMHHHGAGKMRAPRMADELGSSYDLLRRMKRELDPNGTMNPGCLVPLEAPVEVPAR